MPSYQVGKVNGISSTARVIPDVSFFAGSGANNSEGYNNTAYMFCMKSSDCRRNGDMCSSPIQAERKHPALFLPARSRSPWRNIIPVRASDSATSTRLCIRSFGSHRPHDITLGTNELACSSGANCAGGHMTGYAAGTGYDAATGLGSFNITSFITKYTPANTTPSSVALTVTDANGNALPTCVVNGVTSHCIAHSTWVKFVVSTTPSAATGDVSIFTSSPLQAESSVETLTLSNGTANDTWNLLPGGTYNIYARYAGDTTYAPSVSVHPLFHHRHAGKLPDGGVRTQHQRGQLNQHSYGTPVSITVEPYSATTTNNVGIPSGSINVSDNGLSNIITTLPINSEGAATFSSNLLAFGLIPSFLPIQEMPASTPAPPALSWPTSPGCHNDHTARA